MTSAIYNDTTITPRRPAHNVHYGTFGGFPLLFPRGRGAGRRQADPRMREGKPTKETDLVVADKPDGTVAEI